MSSKNDLPTIEVVTEYEFLSFGNKPIMIVKAKDGYLYAALISLCSIFGLNEIKEAERIQKHTILKNMVARASTAGIPNLRYLRIGYMATWLLNLPLDCVENPEDREELISFQQNAALILEEAYSEGRMTDAPRIAELLEFDSKIGNAYREALTVLNLAREHLIAEGKTSAFFYHYSRRHS